MLPCQSVFYHRIGALIRVILSAPTAGADACERARGIEPSAAHMVTTQLSAAQEQHDWVAMRSKWAFSVTDVRRGSSTDAVTVMVIVVVKLSMDQKSPRGPASPGSR